jgi:hypothetical protein
MASARERILETIVTALNAPAEKPLPTVRQRPRPLAVENPDGTSGIDAMLLYALKEEANEYETRVERKCSFRIEIPVAGPPPLDQAADPLYLFIVQTLFKPETLTALAMEDGIQKVFFIEEVGLIWETVSTYVDASVCALEMKFTYATNPTDPTLRV